MDKGGRFATSNAKLKDFFSIILKSLKITMRCPRNVQKLLKSNVRVLIVSFLKRIRKIWLIFVLITCLLF